MNAKGFLFSGLLVSLLTVAAIPARPHPQQSPTGAAPAAKPAPECRKPELDQIVSAGTEVELALAAVPDPRVPRHRRFYDHDIAAFEAGMLEGGYVLDRYEFPWQEALKIGAATVATDDGCYGWILFRNDNWRDLAGTVSVNPETPRVVTTRLLLLVPETSTYGLAARTLEAALAEVDTLLDETPAGSGKQPRRRPASYPGCRAEGEPERLVLFGPTFSGSVESLLHAADQRGSRPSLCAVSASTTASSNTVAERLGGTASPLRLIALAVPDTRRMLELAALAGIDEEGKSGRMHHTVAFLTEASVFGKDICPDQGTRQYEKLDPPYRKLCAVSQQISFPANIADLRTNADAVTKQADQASPLKLPTLQTHLALDDAADNGSEFPESFQTSATSVSTELQLDESLDRLAAFGARIVVVVATDVRDRLFLFEQVRQRLPEALLIDFNADRLLAHPDYVVSSRGALALASSELLCAQSDDRYCINTGTTVAELDKRGQTPRFSAWPTDHHAILAKAVSRLDRPSGGVCRDGSSSLLDCASRPMLVHVVGFDGLHSLASAGSSRGIDLRQLCGVAIGLLSLTVSLIWLLRHDALMRAHAIPERGWFSRLQIRFFTVGNDPVQRMKPVVLLLPALSCGLLLGSGDYEQCALVSVIALLMSVMIERHRYYAARLWAALRGADAGRAGNGGGIVCVLVLVLVIALLLIGELNWRGPQSSRIAQQLTLDASALRSLALNGASGLAYYLALVLTQATLALVCALLLTGLAANARNAWLLPETCTALRAPYDRFLSWSDPLIGIAAVIFFAVALIIVLGGLQLTVFGEAASAYILICLTATTISAIVLLAAQFNVARRTLLLAAFVAHRNRLLAGASAAGLWREDDAGRPLRFAATPVVAAVEDAGLNRFEYVGDASLDFWRGQLADDLLGTPAQAPSRLPLFLLLASEMSLFRGAGLGAAIASLASVLIVYLFPVTAAATFTGISVAVLAGTGLLSGFMAVQFERDEALSNVLCNRGKETQFSTTLFAYIAFPFVVLAAAITITEIPGVLDWGGGFIGWVLNKVGAGL